MIKKAIILLLSSISLLPLKAQDFHVVTGKSVVIDGVTSFGKFACDYQATDETDTIYFNSNIERDFPVLDINLPVDGFGCGNKMLNRDFNKTLQSEEFPYIDVLVERFFREGDDYFSSLKLKLVGKELYIEKLPFILESEEGRFRAEFELSLKYFDLQPPKKFLGLLKVHEELNIKLFLAVQQ